MDTSWTRKKQWLGAVLLFGAGAFALFYFAGSLFSLTTDASSHYALVARLAEYGQLSGAYYPNLEEMSFYPRASHAIAAFLGKMLGSAIVGMQVVATAALILLWMGIAIILHSLPGVRRWAALGILAILLILNRLVIHAELFGNEIIVNYFYAQLVSQSIAMLVLAAALWLERAQTSPELIYVLLGGTAAALPQFHLMAAVETLGILGVLVVMDALARPRMAKPQTTAFGLIIAAASLVMLVINPAFRIMADVATIDGLVELRYIRDLNALAIEVGIVLILSTGMLATWLRLRFRGESGVAAIKYLGALGMAVATACALQIVALKLGYGSAYACRKYAFALNTLVMLEVTLLLIAWARGVPLLSAIRLRRGWERIASGIDPAYAAVAMLLAIFTVMPPKSARAIGVAEIERAEKFALQYREAVPGANAGRYDVALGMLGPHPNVDFLVSIGILGAPRWGNALDMIRGLAPSKPARLGRIFSSIGTVPWDVPECREFTSPEGFVILDGRCVLESPATTSK